MFSAPRAAYIHVPFCRHRCGYCNFTLIAGRDDLIDAYLQALERELTVLGSPRPVDTLFIGGGTPTHLPLPQLGRLLELTTRWFPLAANPEFTVEANPMDVQVDKADLMVEYGVNRLSLGVQSFDEAKLQALERDHRAADIAAALAVARPRFTSLSVDLIFGVPGESLETWRDDLAAVLRGPIDHVSTYGLTFEKGTSFWTRQTRGDLSSLGEELERQMYELAIDTLTARGFDHYEVSNFARPGHRSRHNEAYWLGRSYYAAGPGAARFVDGERSMNHRSTTTYIRRVLAGESPIADAERLEPEDAARERLVFGLRRLAGIDRDEFARETGFSLESLVGRVLPRYLAAGALEWSGHTLRLTRAGLCVSDAIWPAFLHA